MTLSWKWPGKGTVVSIDVRYRKNEKDEAWEAWKVLPADAKLELPISYTVTGLDNGVEYEFQVRATNPLGSSAAVGATAIPKLAVPDAPTNLMAAGGGNEVSLTWTLPTNASEIDDVQVRWKATADLPFDVTDSWINLNDATATAYTVTGLVNGATYSFEVRAVNMKGYGAAASIDATLGLTVPGAPTDFAVTTGDQQANLTWTLPANVNSITAVEVRHRLDSEQTWGIWVELGGTAITHTVTGLVNGATYTFEIRARNAKGPGAAASATVTLELTVPGAPTGLQVTTGDQQADLSWTLPGNVNSITAVEVRHRLDSEQTWGTWVELGGTAITHTVTGLVNGATYTFEVRARNAKGPGAAASATATLELTVPGAPTGFTATAGDTEASLNWTLPLNVNSITAVEVRHRLDSEQTWGGWLRLAATATGHTVTGLVNGATYTFEVRARNVKGPGAAASATVTLELTVPGAPTGLQVTTGDQQAELTWTLPGNVNSITAVEVRHRLDSEQTWGEWFGLAATATGYTVTGLVNGATYSFEVRANNSKGDGMAVTATATLELTVPGAPTGFTATAGDTEASLNWTLPVNVNSITAVEVRHKLGSEQTWGTWVQLEGTATGYTVTGLVNGATYTFEVRARNAKGPGAAASATATLELTVPGAPTGLQVTTGDQQAELTWTLPGNVNSITAVEVRHRLDSEQTWGEWFGLAATATGYTVKGLVNGATYTFEVRARNAKGPGAAASATATLELTVPGAPTGLQVTTGDQQVELTWTLPGNVNSITAVEVRHRLDSEQTWGTWVELGGTAIMHTVTGLVNGATYTFEVRARNAKGPGAAASATATLELTVPGAPTGLQVTTGDQQVELTWTLPGNVNSITAVEVRHRLDSEQTWGTWIELGGTAITYTVTGLVNGATYTFEVRARNAKGPGAAASATATLELTVPGAPTGLQVTTGDQQADLTWTLPANVNSITGVEVRHRLDSEQTWGTWVELAATVTSHTVTGLVNGATYTFEVRARNAKGPGAAASATATLELTVPGAPTGLQVTTGDQQANLTWTLPVNVNSITAVEVRHRLGSEQTWGTWIELGGTAITHMVTGLVNGATYSFELRARNVKGPGAAATATATLELTVPGAPTGLQVTTADQRGESDLDTASECELDYRCGGAPPAGFRADLERVDRVGSDGDRSHGDGFSQWIVVYVPGSCEEFER